MNYKYDTNGLSELSDEIEQAAEMIRFFKLSFICYELSMHRVRMEVRNILKSVYSVPDQALSHTLIGFVEMKIQDWRRERARKW